MNIADNKVWWAKVKRRLNTQKWDKHPLCLRLGSPLVNWKHAVRVASTDNKQSILVSRSDKPHMNIHTVAGFPVTDLCRTWAIFVKKKKKNTNMKWRVSTESLTKRVFPRSMGMDVLRFKRVPDGTCAGKASPLHAGQRSDLWFIMKISWLLSKSRSVKQLTILTLFVFIISFSKEAGFIWPGSCQDDKMTWIL